MEAAGKTRADAFLSRLQVRYPLGHTEWLASKGAVNGLALVDPRSWTLEPAMECTHVRISDSVLTRQAAVATSSFFFSSLRDIECTKQLVCF